MENLPILESGLVKLFGDIRGAQPISVRLATTKKLLKKDRETKENCPFGASVRKESNYLCFVGFDYQNSVNLQRDREEKAADFEALPAWFEHVSGALLRHRENGGHYVQLKIESVIESKYFLETGEEIDEKTLVNYLPAKKVDSGRQGTDKTILTICPTLSSIVGFTYRKNSYVVTREKSITTTTTTTTTETANK